MSPRDAFLGAQEAVPVADAVGRIAAESLAAYPPGIPNVLPGERLTQETLDYIHTTLGLGGSLRGASDRALKTSGGGRVIEDETSLLREVLLGPPENFEWLPTSAISKAALASGVTLTRADVHGRARRDGLGLRGRGREGAHAARRPGAAVPGVQPRLVGMGRRPARSSPSCTSPGAAASTRPCWTSTPGPGSRSRTRSRPARWRVATWCCRRRAPR